MCREPVEDLVRAECGCAFCRCGTASFRLPLTQEARHASSILICHGVAAAWLYLLLPARHLAVNCLAPCSGQGTETAVVRVCRLCVREFVETQVLEASSLSCPKCEAQLTVDLNATTPASGSATANPRRSNKAGTVCVAGKVKVRSATHVDPE